MILWTTSFESYTVIGILMQVHAVTYNPVTEFDS